MTAVSYLDIDHDMIDDLPALYEDVEASCPDCLEAVAALAARGTRSGWHKCSTCLRVVTLSDDVRERVQQRERDLATKAQETTRRRELLGDCETMARFSHVYSAGSRYGELPALAQRDPAGMSRAYRAVCKLRDISHYAPRSAAIIDWLVTRCNPDQWRDLAKRVGYAFALPAVRARWLADLSVGNQAARMHGTQLLAQVVNHWFTTWPKWHLTQCVIRTWWHPVFLFGQKLYSGQSRVERVKRKKRLKTMLSVESTSHGALVLRKSVGKRCREIMAVRWQWPERAGWCRVLGEVPRGVPVAVCDEWEIPACEVIIVRALEIGKAAKAMRENELMAQDERDRKGL